MQIRELQGHRGRIATTAWNGHILTSGSRDKSIINHDGTQILYFIDFDNLYIFRIPFHIIIYKSRLQLEQEIWLPA